MTKKFKNVACLPMKQKKPIKQVVLLIKQVVLLLNPLKGSGCGVTYDLFYSEIDLSEDLYINYNLTMTGTVQSNRMHIPPKIKAVKHRTTKFSFLFQQ